ncbi:phage/plasmid replication domain-containing protein [Pseudomonas syringae]|uniref:phage/plasmid replication domain-containing protein n=1 Tax=Pseudomonas syringae TaxID=317 RepID=UPI00200DC2FF|nr:phage/plasmid replication protein [Pseudomonas syringae]
MMIDWPTVSQEHDHDLPVVCDVFTLTIDSNTNEVLSTRQPRFKHEASHSTSVTIHVQGRKVRVEGNPSRVGRLDNLFGYTSVEQCISVYNALLREYGLPAFTRCTRLALRQGASGSKSSDLVADGAKIERIDLTTNIALGEGNVLAYLRGVSSQRIGHSIGFYIQMAELFLGPQRAMGRAVVFNIVRVTIKHLKWIRTFFLRLSVFMVRIPSNLSM